MVRPSINDIVYNSFVPHFPPGGFTNELFFLLMANIGTTIAPWMLFFQQSSVVDKGSREKDIPFGKMDTVIGSFLTVIVAIQTTRIEFKRRAMGKESIGYIYVLDRERKLVGILDLRDLLMADDENTLEEIMIRRIISLNPQNTLKEAHEMFAKYNLRALPVVDDAHRMLGVLPYRDVINLRHRSLE
jgi:CBS domain-containing protein